MAAFSLFGVNRVPALRPKHVGPEPGAGVEGSDRVRQSQAEVAEGAAGVASVSQQILLAAQLVVAVLVLFAQFLDLFLLQGANRPLLFYRTLLTNPGVADFVDGVRADEYIKLDSASNGFENGFDVFSLEGSEVDDQLPCLLRFENSARDVAEHLLEMDVLVAISVEPVEPRVVSVCLVPVLVASVHYCHFHQFVF